MFTLLLTYAAIALPILAFIIMFLIQGAPYVPSTDEDIELMLKHLPKKKDTYVIDIGSGDGKVVIRLAAKGYRVDGIELNPWLVWRSRRAIKKQGLSSKAHIIWGNFWSFNLSDYDVVIMYAISHIMPRLEEKLRQELRTGAKIISNFFVFPKLKPKKTSGRIRVYEVAR